MKVANEKRIHGFSENEKPWIHNLLRAPLSRRWLLSAVETTATVVPARHAGAGAREWDRIIAHPFTSIVSCDDYSVRLLFCVWLINIDAIAVG